MLLLFFFTDSPSQYPVPSFGASWSIVFFPKFWLRRRFPYGGQKARAMAPSETGVGTQKPTGRHATWYCHAISPLPCCPPPHSALFRVRILPQERSASSAPFRYRCGSRDRTKTKSTRNGNTRKKQTKKTTKTNRKSKFREPWRIIWRRQFGWNWRKRKARQIRRYWSVENHRTTSAQWRSADCNLYLHRNGESAETGRSRDSMESIKYYGFSLKKF